jgi:UDP-3-O-[3-hydroxymyristoyl] N-acetylglucosamine deacetylase
MNPDSISSPNQLESNSVIRIGSRCQRTLSRSVEVHGVGFITGSRVRLRFSPAQEDHGITFLRTDLRDVEPIHANVDSVSGTSRRTTLGSGKNQITLVEHVLAALAGLRIDNCLVQLDGPEPPGLDGSAIEFVHALLDAGISFQRSVRSQWRVSKPLVVNQGKSTLALHPVSTNDLKISYLLDYGHPSPIPPQTHSQIISPDSFTREIASCRTFVLQEEAIELQRQGIGRHLTYQELIVFGSQGPIENSLRFADEPARHKVLDLIGDLALSGLDVVGHIVAFRSGHPLNIELARKLAFCMKQSVGSSVLRKAA